MSFCPSVVLLLRRSVALLLCRSVASLLRCSVALSFCRSAYMEVMEGKGEMQKIKAAMRSVAASGDEILNCLQLSATKVTGLPKSAMPRFKLQLSSPIEELELKKNVGSPESRLRRIDGKVRRGGLLRRYPRGLCLRRRLTSGKQSGERWGAAL